MKKLNSILIISMFVASLFISSCYDDESTLDVNKIDGVEVDTSGIGNLNVYQFNKLKIEPKINTNGIPESRLSYKWKINVTPREKEFIVIGEEKSLDYEVGLLPTTDDLYDLTLTITDNKYQLDYITNWKVEVKNSLGEGLVIAETNDDTNSDLSILMTPEVTEGFSEGFELKKSVYSKLNNGMKLSGLIKQMKYNSVYGEYMIHAITDNAYYWVNREDFVFNMKNEDLFYNHSSDFNIDKLYTVNQGDIIIENGKFTVTYLGASRKYGNPNDNSINYPIILGINPQPQTAVAINFYEESLGKFKYQKGTSSFNNAIKDYEDSPGAQFNPFNLPNKLNIAAGLGKENEFVHILKDKTDNSISLYTFNPGVYPELPKPIGKFDITSAPEIENAKNFVFLIDQRVIYYNTDTKIYAIMYSNSTPVIEERYTTTGGEKITTFQLYQQGNYPFAYGYEHIATNNKQVIVSTYSSEGKIYIMPIINQGVGNLDIDNTKIYTGFDKITAITVQK